MKILLTKQCESLTGSLGRGLGYHIQRRKNAFYGVRQSKGIIPPCGHWRFILACAQLAQTKLYVADIQISWTELHDALVEAHYFVAGAHVTDNGLEKNKLTYDAQDIINLKYTFGL